jgi:hypothetical protein
MDIDRAKQIVTEIQNADLDVNDCAYVRADGEWEIGREGAQPSYTQAIGSDDFDECTVDEIAYVLVLFADSITGPQ